MAQTATSTANLIKRSYSSTITIPLLTLSDLPKLAKKLRIAKAYTPTALGKEAGGLSHSVVLRLENGSGTVTVATLYRISKMLSVPVKSLFDFRFKES